MYSPEILFEIQAWSAGKLSNYNQNYETRTDRWVKVAKANPPAPGARNSTPEIGFNIYVIGSSDGVYYLHFHRCFTAVTCRPYTFLWRPTFARQCKLDIEVICHIIFARGQLDIVTNVQSIENCDENLNS